MQTLFPGDEKQDEKNIGQDHADRRFNDLSGAEKRGTVDMSDFERNYGENADSSQEDANIEKARQQESDSATGAPDSGIINNVKGKPAPQKLKIALNFAKKRGGIIGLLGLLGVGGGLIAALLGPASMLINLMENFVDTNDTTSTAMERRFMKVFGSMTNADPICANNSKLSIKCRMGRISNSAIASMAKKGVVAYGDTIDTTNKKGYPTRNPTGYTVELNGKKVNVAAADLPGFLNKNPKIAAQVLGVGGAFNLKYKSWASKYLTNKFFNKFGLTKSGGIADGKNKRLSGADRINESLKKLTSKLPGIDKVQNISDKVKGKVDSHLNKAAKGGVGYLAAVGGCVAAKAPGYISAGVAAIQLAQIMPVANELILSPGSKAKASSSLSGTNAFTADDMDAVAAPLTQKTPRKSDGKLTSALDSPYLLAAMGVNKGKLAVSSFVPGYGVLTNPTMKALNTVEDATKPACNAILSPAAMYSAMAVDAAVTVTASATIIGGVIKVAGSWALSAIISAAVGQIVGAIAGEAVTAILTDIAKNDDVAKAQGEALGDVVGISAMAYFSGAGMARHLPALKQSQLVAYNEIDQKNKAFEREMAIASLSPFDASSKYTFMGSILHNARLGLIQSGAYNSTGIFSSLASLAKLPFANMSFNDVSAAQDLTLERCGYASAFDLEAGENTPAINAAGLPCTGLTVEQDSMSTGEAVDLMLQEGWLDESKTISDGATIEDLISAGYIVADTPLTNFIESCSNPDTGDYLFNSVGCTVDSPADGTSRVDEGLAGNTSSCITNDEGESSCPSDASGFEDVTPLKSVSNDRSLAAMSVFLLDYQLMQSINGEDEEGDITSSETQAGTGRPENTTDRNGGWTLTNNVDYSSVQCDPRTPDAGTFTSPQYGWTIRLCQMTHNTKGSADNGGNLVNALISTNAMNMFEALEKEVPGVTIGLSDGMRKNPPSYFSMHSTGLAMDLGVPRGGQTICYGGSTTNGWGSLENAERACAARGGDQYHAYKWLRANSQKYGLFNYEKEPWHYSTSGNGV